MSAAQSTDAAVAQFAAGLHSMSVMLEPILDAVDGYRADLGRRGYSPTVAEAMALEYHGYLMVHLMAQVTR